MLSSCLAWSLASGDSCVNMVMTRAKGLSLREAPQAREGDGLVSERRFGLENSQSRATLLDAAEQLMREEGYAAVTSDRKSVV